jgi:O-antigen/teichoic acid export membrane protein
MSPVEPRGARPPARFRRATSTVLLGTIAGHAVTLGLTPLLTRLYAPEAWGLFSTIVAVASTFVGISTFRLEVLAQREKDGARATALLRLALLAAIGWSVALSVGGAVAVLIFDTPWLWCLTGLLVFLASMQLIGTAALVRDSRYKSLALLNFTQGAVAGVVQLALGLITASAAALLAGFAAARVFWLTRLRGLVRRDEREAARPEMDQVRRYGIPAGASALVNSLSSQVPILATATVFDASAAGLVALAFRVLISPLGIVSQSAAAASLGVIGRQLREGDVDVRRATRRSMAGLGALGVAACAAAAILGLTAAEFLFGPEWSDVGEMIALLSIGAAFQFVGSPFSQVLNLTSRSARLLLWDVCRLLAYIASFGVPYLLDMNILSAIAAYSAVQIGLYCWLLAEIDRALRPRLRKE